MGRDYSFAHAAALMAQMPRTSRTAMALNPDNEWSEATYFLAQIEYDLRVLIWQNTKDGQKGRNQPKPPTFPAERAQRRKRIEGFDKALVDKVLGGADGDRGR